MMLNGLLTVAEAAKRLNLSITQITKLCRQEKFPGAEKISGAWFIPEESVASYKPGPQGFAAVWKRLKEEKSALEAERAALAETKQS